MDGCSSRLFFFLNFLTSFQFLEGSSSSSLRIYFLNCYLLAPANKSSPPPWAFFLLRFVIYFIYCLLCFLYLHLHMCIFSIPLPLQLSPLYPAQPMPDFMIQCKYCLQGVIDYISAPCRTMFYSPLKFRLASKCGMEQF